MFYSPLRYPGGKTKLSKFIASVCINNNINGHYVEPYAGGASVALFLLLKGYVKKITINDSDRSIYAFWHSLLERTDDLCGLIKITEVNIESWKRCKAVQENKNKSPLLELGFSTFFLNRTNISGIIDGGIIGGWGQKGKYKIDCRFNKEELLQRIKRIATIKNRIRIYNLDALDLVKIIQKESQKNSTIFYFDPPYFLKGKSLYMNHYEHDDHKKVSEEIQKINNFHWIVSYDAVSEIKEMYKNCNKLEYSLRHTAIVNKVGKEVLFFSKNLIVPRVVSPLNISS